MNWLQLSLPSTKETVDAWGDILVELGAVAVTLAEDADQPIFELTPEHSPLWDYVKLVALFPEDFDQDIITTALQNHIPAEILSQAAWQTIVEEDWQLKWQENLRPMQFGEKIWVCPSWCEPPDPTALNIILDPEMAFGTGTHQTTALCLDWIAHNMQPGTTVIDYGCGSGILAIAAVKMGAAQVYAVDIDPIALDVSNSNAQKNSITPDLFHTYLPETVPDNIKTDVVIANILANPLMDLAPLLANFLQADGIIVLSGILTQQAAMIQERYAEWFTNFTITTKDEWVRITAIKK